MSYQEYEEMKQYGLGNQQPFKEYNCSAKETNTSDEIGTLPLISTNQNINSIEVTTNITNLESDEDMLDIIYNVAKEKKANKLKM